MYRKKIAIGLMAVVVLAVLPAFGDDNADVNGMIITGAETPWLVKSARVPLLWSSPPIRQRRTTEGFLAWRSSKCPIWCLYPDLRCG